VGRQSDIFEMIDKKWRIFRRVGPVRPERIDFPIVPREGTAADEKRPPPPPPRPLNAADLTRQLLLESYAPAAVLINPQHGILYSSGPTMRYLDQPTGEPTRDLMLLAREGLRPKLRAAVHRAARESQPVTEGRIRLKRNGSYASVSLTVRPVR